MKILVASDIHIGRIPSVPYPESDKRIIGRAAWEAVVKKAIDLSVDVVVLAGDVVEHDNAWFEAYGPLLKGIDQLNTKGIAVFGVAGNHDADVFPKLVQDCPAIKLLGMQEKKPWESVVHKGVQFIGWSFPKTHYTQNPFDSFPVDIVKPGSLALGILHCDLDPSGDSCYAPVKSGVLAQKNVPFWILGHIHQTGLRANNKALYCGSPFSLDSGEEGRHGVWLLETSSGNNWKEPEFIQLSPWFFKSLTVQLHDAANNDDVRGALLCAMRNLGESLKDNFQGDVFCKLIFEGTIHHSQRLSCLLPNEQLAMLEVPYQGLTLRPIDQYEDRTSVSADLEALAKGTGPKALLAKQLLNMDTIPGIVQTVRNIERDSWYANTFCNMGLPSQDISEDACKQLIRQAGHRLLQAMLAQETIHE